MMPRINSVRPGFFRSASALGSWQLGDSQQERDHYRYRVAGQAEKVRLTDSTKGQRAAGFDRQTPESDLTKLVQCSFDKIGLPQRNPA